MTIVITPELTMKEISSGVAEVYAGSYQVGMITWNPERMTTAWYTTYANGDETIQCADRAQALEFLRQQHAVVQRLARSIRSIRPATGIPGCEWDMGYNSALRDVERILREVVGRAPKGEGYTAITNP